MHRDISMHSGIACNDMTRRDTERHGLKQRGVQPTAVRPGAVVRFAPVRGRHMPDRDPVLLYEHGIAEAA